MTHYCLNCGKELTDVQYICPDCHHNVYLDSLDDKMLAASGGILSAINIEKNTQWAKYRCGKEGSTGHGFAAEDYNALNDKLNGFDVGYSGRDNKENGSDRISDGLHIQVKYCATPKSTVNAAFSESGKGTYRYYADGQPQILEVPSDQYEQCVRIMEDKIQQDQVPGVKDPKMAKTLVRKGSCTYTQAKNIAKAGNIDSLWFDVKTGAVVALSSIGISFSVTLALASISCRNMDDFKCAIQLSFLDGLKSGSLTLSSSILTTQLIRTQFGRNFVAFVQRSSKDSINNIYDIGIGKKAIHDIASGLWQKKLVGASAKNVVTKLVRLNAITNTVTFLVMSVPDIYRCFLVKSISKPQFIENLTVNASSIAGATIGALIGLKFGKPGAMIGGMAGGSIAGLLSKTIAKTIRKDDVTKMQELIKIALLELSNEYALQSQEEFDAAIRNISLHKAVTTNLLRAMYTIGAENNDDALRVDFAKLMLGYEFDIVIRQRRQIKLLNNEQLLLNAINEIEIDAADITSQP